MKTRTRTNVRPSRRHQSCEHSLESLEARTLLSNVTAEFQNGDLRISGDGNDNSVEITQTPSGFIVRGLDGTGINGRPPNGGSFLATNEPVDDVHVSFAAGGDNSILLIDLDIEDDLIVRGGDGRDAVGVVAGRVGDDVKIKTQNGNDLALVQLLSADIVNINTGNGRDKAVVLGVPNESIVNKMTIKTGNGSDEVLVAGYTTNGNVSINTGSGNDAVFMQDLQLNRGMKVSMSSGDDDFYMTTSRVVGRASVNGGNGVDHAQLFVNPIQSYNERSIEGNVVADASDRISDLVFCALNGFPDGDPE